MLADVPLPYLNISIMQLILYSYEVNYDVLEASADEKETPIFACFNAWQSLEPSPIIAT